MAHYDSECKFCGKFDQFADVDCDCLKSIAYRKEIEDKEKAEFNAGYAYLKLLNCPIIHSFDNDKWNSYNRRKFNLFVDWVRQIKRTENIK